MSDFVPPDVGVLDRFIPWLEGLDWQRAREWGLLYCSDLEAAMCEAIFWRELTDRGVLVRPNGPPGPDFLCERDGQRFYVEVTCIQRSTVARRTGLPVDFNLDGGAQAYGSLNDAILEEVRSKTPQCANLDAPCVLAIGTFHTEASVLCVKKMFVEWLLTGTPSIEFQVGPSPMSSAQVTRYRSAAYLRPNALIGAEPARQPVSAMLLAGFGLTVPRIFGATHPDPVRTFDPVLLDRIPFCRLRGDCPEGVVSTEWTHDPEPDGTGNADEFFEGVD